nr:immunoglobulin light chain junction region [Macaca mulatta]
CLQHNNSPLTF